MKSELSPALSDRLHLMHRALKYLMLTASAANDRDEARRAKGVQHETDAESRRRLQHFR